MNINNLFPNTLPRWENTSLVKALLKDEILQVNICQGTDFFYFDGFTNK